MERLFLAGAAQLDTVAVSYVDETYADEDIEQIYEQMLEVISQAYFSNPENGDF